MSSTTLWSRIGGWLKSPGPRSDTPREGPALEDASLPIDEGLADDDGAGLLARQDRPPGAFHRWTRRDQTLQRLQEGYERLAETIDSVQSYLAAQERRGQQIEGLLHKLTESAGGMSAQSRQALELLDQLAQGFESAGRRNDRLMELLGELPETNRRQTEALGAIGRRLELFNETDAQIAGSLQTVGRAVDNWHQSVDRQNDLISKTKDAIERNDELLNTVLVRQGKWMWMLGGALVVAAAAVAVAVAALVT